MPFLLLSSTYLNSFRKFESPNREPGKSQRTTEILLPRSYLLLVGYESFPSTSFTVIHVISAITTFEIPLKT